MSRVPAFLEHVYTGYVTVDCYTASQAQGGTQPPIYQTQRQALCSLLTYTSSAQRLIRAARGRSVLERCSASVTECEMNQRLEKVFLKCGKKEKGTRERRLFFPPCSVHQPVPGGLTLEYNLLNLSNKMNHPCKARANDVGG